MGKSRQVDRTLVIGWRVAQALIAAGFVYAGWRLLGHLPYRIDIEVYRMGARAWLDDHPLYAGDVTFHTRIGLDLPFTYPPLAAILFSPFAWLSFQGRWGERQPSFNNGPTGPTTKDQWDHPIRWMEEEGRDGSVSLPPAGTRVTDFFCYASAAGSMPIRDTSTGR